MNREEFGRLIAALRKENIDMRAGKVWTQKMLAEKANLSERTIGQLEQGDKMNLEPQVLAQLAKALNLTSMERRALYAAAAEVDMQQYLAFAKPAAAILDELLAATNHLRCPAFIYDSYCNVIALNTLIRALSILPDALLASGPASPAGFNLLRYYFAPESPYKTLLAADWTTFALRVVQHFRAASLPYRYTERFTAIFKDLCQYPLFQDFWVRTKFASEDIYHRWEGIAYQHPQLGPLDYIITEVATLTGCEDLYLVTYVPRDRQTVAVFEDLARQAGVNMTRLQPWPYQ
ncbi:MAG: helix-turn-helix domain-containing protein [Caldilineaceae bacterium]